MTAASAFNQSASNRGLNEAIKRDYTGSDPPEQRPEERIELTLLFSKMGNNADSLALLVGAQQAFAAIQNSRAQVRPGARGTRRYRNNRIYPQNEELGRIQAEFANYLGTIANPSRGNASDFANWYEWEEKINSRHLIASFDTYPGAWNIFLNELDGPVSAALVVVALGAERVIWRSVQDGDASRFRDDVLLNAFGRVRERQDLEWLDLGRFLKIIRGFDR